MPELPEVETVRRGLEPILVGQTFARVEQRRPDLRVPLPAGFARRLADRRVLSVGRRAKYLLIRLDGGEVLVVHLGMSGRVAVTPGVQGAAAHVLGEYVNGSGGSTAHDHVVFTMGSGAVVTYNDPRRFGFMLLLPETELPAHKLFLGLGVEPLGPDLTAAYLASRAHGRAVDLKAFLMDQRIVAGLGNIYVCEALFHAGLSPRRAASSLANQSGRPTPRAERLVPAIRRVLTDAIAAGGSTLRNYAQADGSRGAFQNKFSVYNRAGERCLKPGCRGRVRRIVQAGRSSFNCSVCQR